MNTHRYIFEHISNNLDPIQNSYYWLKRFLKHQRKYNYGIINKRKQIIGV